MRLKQLSIFQENTPGHLQNLCKIIADASVNLQTLTIVENRDYGIVRAIVDKPEAAQEALKKEGVASKIVEVLAVEVEDVPGALLEILDKTSAEGINVEYMYALTRPMRAKPTMVMAFKDIDRAEAILS